MTPSLPPLGAHMSIAGGVDKAPGRARAVRCTALQIFVKNNNRWDGPAITPATAEAFCRELEGSGVSIRHVFAHTCYLINLASPKEEVAERSEAALEDELRRCELIGVPGLVMHPGSHLGTGRDAGIKRIAAAVKRVVDRTPNVRTRILFETTAGTGSNIGGPFEDLQELLDLCDAPDRTGVCLDTCHIFAAGYDLRTREAYEKSMDQLARTVGFHRLHAVHLNDSKHPLGSKKDRHEHIGRGHLGEEPFRFLLGDERFRHIPMALETEKDEELTEDRINLGTLYRLGGAVYQT